MRNQSEQKLVYKEDIQMSNRHMKYAEHHQAPGKHKSNHTRYHLPRHTKKNREKKVK